MAISTTDRELRIAKAADMMIDVLFAAAKLVYGTLLHQEDLVSICGTKRSLRKRKRT